MSVYAGRLAGRTGIVTGGASGLDMVWTGIGLLVLATVVIGYGNCLGG